MPKPREVDINVHLHWNAGKVGFNPSSPVRGGDTLTGKHRFVFKNKGHPGFIVRFNIIDDHGYGYVFPDDLTNAMWVKTIGEDEDDCPTEPCHWEGFEAVAVENANRTLVVSNENWNEQRFAFTLRMNKDPHGTGEWIEYDPIGEDKNGPRQFSLLSIALPLLGLGGAALIAYVGVKSIRG